jgi:hypothetical protein
MVGGHEENTAFLGTYTIEGIEEPRERNLSATSFLLHGRSFHEDTIDIF